MTGSDSSFPQALIGQIPSGKRKNQKLGINFSLMVVGPSGLGKSTFLSTLCSMNNRFFSRPYESHDFAAEEKTTEIKSNTVEINDGKFSIELTLIDTPGFGDSINNEKNFEEILSYVERKYDDIMIEESRIRRNPKIQDHRIHALLYFISPTGRSLRELDVKFMSTIARRINVIPVIAKADSLTPEELVEFKHRINEDIAKNAIPIYDMPLNEDECEGEALAENSELRNLRPFAICASRETRELPDGTVIRCREYPWGVVNIESETHCDFSRLRTMLFRTDLYTLREITHNVLYEQYRTERLSAQDPNLVFAVSQASSNVTNTNPNSTNNDISYSQTTNTSQ